LCVRPGAYPTGEYLKGASLWQALAVFANIRIDLKFLTGTNTLAYYKNKKICL
jgi:hypothetical protein